MKLIKLLAELCVDYNEEELCEILRNAVARDKFERKAKADLLALAVRRLFY